MRAIAEEERTLVLFEAPHRIAITIADMIEVLGPLRRVALAREMTKMHEEVLRGTLAELAEAIAFKPPRGEITLIVQGAAPQGKTILDDETLSRMVAEQVDKGVSQRDAINAVAAETGMAKNRVYKSVT